MQKIDIKKIIETKAPDFFLRNPEFVNYLIIQFLNNFLRVKDINHFLEQHNQNYGIEFIDKLFEYLNVNYEIKKTDFEKIPSEGKLIIVSNHPLGGLDGLSLIRTIYEIRKDVKIVANDVLMQISNISEFILPIDLYSMSKQRIQLVNIEKSLRNEEAIIFFPSGKVSRLFPNGIHDNKWHNGPTKYSAKYAVPILPVYVKARNSLLFYFMSLINTKLGMLMLPQELLKKRNTQFKIIIGDLIPGSTFNNSSLKPKIQSKLLRQHTFRIGKEKSGLFITEKTIIHPVEKSLIKDDLSNNTLLGTSYDNKQIYLVDYELGKNVLREISRLRELTFRKVGEGTGKTFDIDVYDYQSGAFFGITLPVIKAPYNKKIASP